MDFLCCSERWTCPSRPRFPLLNLHHIAHRGCFHSLWPKWNYLLLKLKHSKEATEWSRTVWTSISSPRGRAFHALWESQKATRKQNKFCKVVRIEVWHPYSFHTQNIPRESTAACEPVPNTFSGHSHSMYQDLDDELPYKGHRKYKKNTPGWMLGCKYKHVLFRRADTKAVPFMITKQSTVLSPVWQQLMQMCAAQQCSAEFSPPPLKSVQQAGHIGVAACCGWNAETLSSMML